MSIHEISKIRILAGDSSVSRRLFLASLGSIFCAGCSGTDDSREVPYQHLDSEPLYLGSSFDTKLPVTVSRVDDPTAATLAVLSEETMVAGDRIVEWLRDGTPVAVAGRPAEPTLYSLLTAGDYQNHFDTTLNTGGDREYLVAAVAPSDDGQRLGTLLASSEWEDPIARCLEDVLSGIVAN